MSSTEGNALIVLIVCVTIVLLGVVRCTTYSVTTPADPILSFINTCAYNDGRAQEEGARIECTKLAMQRKDLCQAAK